MASSSRGRGRGNGTDQRDGAQQSSGGITFGRFSIIYRDSEVLIGLYTK